ncbi:P-loop containing nucleoside triphosphate hydrolase protein [Lipomyces japonicus]|uniref:P-loop containing nucleoside triphosphate hydrolase protein n=1 Tax=Lipomyces japonicus TaxID=56871 RepID=UPI0034CEF33A
MADDEKKSLRSDSLDYSQGLILSPVDEKQSFFSFRSFKRSKSYAAISDASAEKVNDEFDALPEHEAEILRAQVDVIPSNKSYFTLFRYADSSDKLVLLLGVLCAIGEGATKPLLALVIGSVSDQFADYRPNGYSEYMHIGNSTLKTSGEIYPNYNYENYISPEDFYSTMNRLSLYLVLIGIGSTLLSYISTYIFIDRGEVLSARVREHYLAATLKQNIGYFDRLGTGEITSRISSDTLMVQEAISEKIAFIIAHVSTLAIAIIIALSKSYILTLIMFAVLFSIFITTGMSTIYMVKFQKKAHDGYSVGGTVAEEVISSVRNVQAFGIQSRMVATYETFLATSEFWGIHAGVAAGLMNGSMYLCSFSTDAMAHWQGVRLLVEGQITLGTIMTIVFTIFQGAYAFAIISPHLSTISSGIAAASKIFATIDRTSAIDSSNEKGLKLDQVEGNIELKDIKFIYPSRPKVTVMNNFSLSIPAGKTVALVGSSGSGKSTIIGLIERFYNPISGEVLLDNNNITDLNIRWLRQKIALVSQEPTLFACSIYENIAYGLIGTDYEFSSDIEKRELVIEACKQANAWTFIEQLPEGLETNVGERGFLLSGGQKQRIAISRAIVSNPKILLLDEATSALDTKSEGIVQEALDRASKNRTTIVIAHRLSTIKDADIIVVMKRGEIIEMGNHNELISRNGEYYDLVKAQQIESLKEKRKQELSHESIELDELTDLTRSSLTLTRTKTAMSFSSITVESEHEVQGPSFLETLLFITNLSSPEIFYNILGLLACIVSGMVYPALGILYGSIMRGYRDLTDFSELRPYIERMAGFLFLLAVAMGFGNAISGASFGYTSAKLVRRIRKLTFQQMLRQDIEFFDRDENTVGTLTGTLARDAQAVEGLGGVTLGKIIDSFVTVVVSCIVSIAFAWKLGLVVTSTVPILMGCGFYRFYLLTAFEEKVKSDNEVTSSFACEAASSIRTVVSLTRERDVWETYHASLNSTIKRNRKSSMISALFYGLCQGQFFFIVALTFWYGSQLIGSGEYNLFQFYIVFMSIVFGAESAGVVFSFAPDMGKAIQSAKNIKMLLEKKPVVDTWSSEGAVPSNVKGEIEFKNVHFKYPTRPEVPVLQGLNLHIKQGQYVALVGGSGCGKSTTIGLIEEFYRPLKGEIKLDGTDIKSFNINKYREQIALVSQEPTLYGGSIRYNIELGSSDIVSLDDIKSACRQANIHDFIMSLPDGYDTICGSKGSFLSGGQKQRIAIARALIRNPKVLLLDEATSALDSESEKIVQAALDAAAKGRTTIAVAHRLSTIQNADVIYVFEAGKVCESGNHQELLAKKGRYYELVQLQVLEGN